MRFKNSLLAAALALAAGSAQATDGYFPHGYGVVASGRGGATVALTDNASGAATNPATLAFAGSQLEIGATAFRPTRSASRSGLGPGLDGISESGHDWFPIPEVAFNHVLSNGLALGVSVYGNGGMNTDYPAGAFNCGRGPANALCGSSALGVNLMQAFVAPTLAWAFTPNQSIGIAPLFAFQRFTAKGLQAFAGTPGLSSNPAAVTNRGADYSHGVGFRVGYYARLDDAWSIGAAYAGKLAMSRFERYAGLFAGRGGFDIPQNYSVGVAFRPAAPWTLALDWQRINYAGVASVGNPSLRRAQLGAANGPGFGWHDVTVWKLGIDYAATDRLTLRAGFNHSGNPIRASDVTFNILAPGVVTNHLTLGASWRTQGGEVSVAWMHAFEHAVTGTSILPAFMGGAPAGSETIRMHEDSLGVAWTWRL